MQDSTHMGRLIHFIKQLDTPRRTSMFLNKQALNPSTTSIKVTTSPTNLAVFQPLLPELWQQCCVTVRGGCEQPIGNAGSSSVLTALLSNHWCWNTGTSTPHPGQTRFQHTVRNVISVQLYISSSGFQHLFAFLFAQPKCSNSVCFYKLNPSDLFVGSRAENPVQKEQSYFKLEHCCSELLFAHHVYRDPWSENGLRSTLLQVGEEQTHRWKPPLLSDWWTLEPFACWLNWPNCSAAQQAAPGCWAVRWAQCCRAAKLHSVPAAA